MIGKWNDILIHGNFTSKEDGFYKVWVNNELKYEHKSKVSELLNPINFFIWLVVSFKDIF